MTFREFFLPLSNKKIKRLLIGSIIIVIIAIIIDSSIKDNEDIPIEITNKIGEIIVEDKVIEKVVNNKTTVLKSNNEEKTKQEIKTEAKPEISAEEYLVANIETGEIYLAKNTKEVFPIASISKLITALVSKNLSKPDQKVTITSKMIEPYGDAGKLAPGEIYSVDELLYPLLIESSNDAGEAIAESYGYESFVYQMNSIVYEIGMENTSFRDSSGLSNINSSNAEDLFVLAKYLYNYEKPILNITKKTEYSIASTTGHIEHNYKNINPFSLEENFIGGKTGRTNEAKESMLSIWNYKALDKTYIIAIIVLRSEFNERENDTKALLRQFIEKIEGN